MLITIPILIYESASVPPVETVIGIDPGSIARVEISEEDGIVNWWADGMNSPRKTRATVAEFVEMVNSFLFAAVEEDYEEDQSCRQDSSKTE